jgi:DNA polymerase-1
LVLKFKDLFANENILKVGQNIKFDMQMLKSYGVEVAGPYFDTMIAHYLLQPEQRHNFDFLVETYLNYHPVEIEELIGPKGKDQKTMRDVDPQLIKEYAGEDADLTLQLKAVLEKELEKNGFTELFKTIEIPLLPVLTDIEFEGVKVDKENLANYSKELTEKIKKVETDIYAFAETEFNIASPKQMGEILFEKMKIIPNPKKTKTGQYSTSEQELQNYKVNTKL